LAMAVCLLTAVFANFAALFRRASRHFVCHA
jgi:hypothetical protein